jgi:hypothetical protein
MNQWREEVSNSCPIVSYQLLYIYWVAKLWGAEAYMLFLFPTDYKIPFHAIAMSYQCHVTAILLNLALFAQR